MAALAELGQFDKAVERQEKAIATVPAGAKEQYRERLGSAGIEEATLKLIDGSTAGLTLHTVDGTIPQLRRALIHVFRSS